MKFNLSGLKNLVFSSNPLLSEQGYPSAELALARILGRRKLTKIIERIADRRQMMEEAAKLKALSENELIKQVAELLGLPVYFNLKPPDLSVLPENISLQDLRRSGVCPLIYQENICGLVCAEPANIAELQGFYNGNNLYLSSWQAVLAALEQSEQIYFLSRQKSEQSILNRDNNIFDKILLKLSSEIEQKQATELQFSYDENCLSYQLLDNQGIEWDGQIDQSIAPKFLEFMEQRIASTQLEVKTEQGTVLCCLSASHGKIFLKKAEAVLQTENCRIIRFPQTGSEPLRRNQIRTETDSANILLLDDNPGFAEVLQRYLMKEGFGVESFYSLDSVWKRLQRNDTATPDVIVSDLNLSDGCGYSFIGQLKSEEKLKEIPLVILTSEGSQESEIRALSLGADAFVTKTKDPRILILHIKRLISYKVAA